MPLQDILSTESTRILSTAVTPNYPPTTTHTPALLSTSTKKEKCKKHMPASKDVWQGQTTGITAIIILLTITGVMAIPAMVIMVLATITATPTTAGTVILRAGVMAWAGTACMAQGSASDTTRIIPAMAWDSTITIVHGTGLT